MSKISKAKRRQVFNNSKGLCANCKTKIDYSTHNWSLDHMREKQFGGSSDNDNLQAVCKQCHHWKNLIICANKTQGLIPTDEDLEEQQQRRIDLLDTYRTTQQDLNDQINSLKRECVGQHNRINACGVWCAIGIIAISLYRLRSWKN
jgi:hypothetical protein